MAKWKIRIHSKNDFRSMWIIALIVGAFLASIAGVTVYITIKEPIDLATKLALLTMAISLICAYSTTVINAYLMHKSNIEITKESRISGEIYSQRISAYKKIWEKWQDYAQIRRQDYDLYKLHTELCLLLEKDCLLFYCSNSFRLHWRELRKIDPSDIIEYTKSVRQLMQLIEKEVLI